jgi:hypothetical protein
MGHNQKMVMDTIRLILDDDTNTELSPLHQLNIHIVADAMKWAIRYSQETLVSYEDFQTYYVNQGKAIVIPCERESMAGCTAILSARGALTYPTISFCMTG